MPRLIDADALIDDMCEDCGAIANGACDKDVCASVLWVKDAPTIEAKPVRHGRWNIRTFDLPREGYYCSKCGTVEWRTSRFCPNCGAKMDGGAKE